MAVDPVHLVPAHEPCCPALQCRYRPSKIKDYLKFRSALRSMGFDPTEGLDSFLASSQGYEMGRSSSSSPSSSRRAAAEICADLEMAHKAGCFDSTAISRFLCPFGELDDERAAVDQPSGQALD